MVYGFAPQLQNLSSMFYPYEGEDKMKKKIIIEFTCDSQETWEVTQEEVNEILLMMNNLKRNAKIVEIEDLS